MSTRMQDLLMGAWEQLRHEPMDQRVRATIGTETVIDSTRAMLVWEPRRVVPSYAVPVEDVAAELSTAPTANGDVAGVLHPGVPFSVHTAAGEPVSIGSRPGAGFRLADEDVSGYVVLDFDAFDDWYEEDERVTGHPREPFHRVESRRSSRAVRIEIDGDLVAETTRARLVLETSLPVRFYIPREDVRATLHASSGRSHCPYKGHATWWTVQVGGRGHEDLAWSYQEPLPELAPIAGLVAFWDERVDVFLDGERRDRPTGPIADAFRDEFGLP